MASPNGQYGWHDLPNNPGVRVTSTEQALQDPKIEWSLGADGNIYAGNKAGVWTKLLPYMVGGAMVYGQIAAALAAGASGAGGASSVAAQAAGTGGAGTGASATGVSAFGPMSAGAEGVLPSASIPTATAMSALPPSIASQGISQGVGAGLGAAAGKTTGNIRTGLENGGGTLRNILGLGVAGLGALNGMRQPSANKGLEDMLGLATDRVNSSKPLFDALQAMALGSMPTWTKGGQ